MAYSEEEKDFIARVQARQQGEAKQYLDPEVQKVIEKDKLTEKEYPTPRPGVPTEKKRFTFHSLKKQLSSLKGKGGIRFKRPSLKLLPRGGRVLFLFPF